MRYAFRPLTTAVFAIGMLVCRDAVAQEAPRAEPPPDQWEPTTWLWVSGAALFVLDYAIPIPLTRTIALSEGSKFADDHAQVMAIPFAGPWLEMAGVVEPQSSHGAAGLAVLGLLQLGGAAMTIAGVVGVEPDSTPSPIELTNVSIVVTGSEASFSVSGKY